jgi:hypothetical protein
MTLNEAKYAFLEAAVGQGGKLNELEHLWLDLQGVTVGKTLDEKWYELFGQSDKSWNEAAHAWLTLQGVPAGGTLDERFYLFYTTP